jgi:hypothetical protein
MTATQSQSAVIVSAGMIVRVLVKGHQRHSVDGFVTSSRPTCLTIKVAANGREISFPAEAILSIEVAAEDRRDTTSWQPGRMPVPMTEAASGICRLFLTGAGANIRALTGRALEEAAQELVHAQQEVSLAANRRIISELEHAVDHAAKCMQSAAQYEEAEWLYQELTDSLATPSPASVPNTSEYLATAVEGAKDRLATLMKEYWRRYQTTVAPKPAVIVGNTDTVVDVAPTLDVKIPVKVSLASTFAPAHNVRLILLDTGGLQLAEGEPVLPVLKSGAIEKLTAAMLAPEDFLLAPRTIQIRAQLKFQTTGRNEQLSPVRTLKFILNPPERFKRIDNPFAPYAGGTTVSNPDMFFGRESLLGEVTAAMQSGPRGQCYALYGQKRTGKSSFLEQVEARLAKPAIPITLSFGTVDQNELTSSVVREILHQVQINVALELTSEDARRVNHLWPDEQAIATRPLESLKSSIIGSRKILSRYTGWAAVRFILLVDEFTYLFEVLRRSTSGPHELATVRDFMRQWKALLDTQVFSAVVVGQDTMPYAMKKFANEFSNMTPKRLSYLERAETNELADRPIRRDDKGSRYVGYALDRIHEYTDGHPFFTQILCDRLVQRSNASSRGSITDGDVDEAVESLVAGQNAIELFRFDCFLSADNTGLPVDILSDDYSEIGNLIDDEGGRALELLVRLANMSGAQNRWVSVEQLGASIEEVALLNDLTTREVILRDGPEHAKVRVLLFAEYLRRLR